MEYTYNSSGLLAKTEDKSNNTIIKYEYDPYGNVTKIACASETDNGTALSVTDYTYDEWGKPIETLTRYGTENEQKIAEINPLRYRGYYYDSETGYCYLQSRYYNPEWGTFISPTVSLNI